MNFKNLCETLENKIQSAYTSGTTLDEAEKLAGEFLYAQLKVSEELKLADLDSRMRKSGLKAVKATVYMEACSKTDKKPTETQLEHILNTNSLVQAEQESLDTSEVSRDSLERYYDIFREAHVHFRQLSKGKFE